MIQIVKGVFIGLCLLWCLALEPPRSLADVGLIVETPTGILGYLSDVGHSSVWISRGCLTEEGEVSYCEGSAGIVLSSTAYWSNPGTAAIPAELFFLGSEPGHAGRSVDAWNTYLGATYPRVIPAYGRKFLGRAWRRGMRVTTFATTPEEDRQILWQIEQQRKKYRYSYSHRNCAFYAQSVLQLYLGNGFHSNRVFDWGVYTPRALERALLHHLEADPSTSFRVLTFPGTLSQSWRQPPRNFCESALFDPKFAIPLLMFQPYIYVGFGACYGATRIAGATWHKQRRPEIQPFALVADIPATGRDPRLITYRKLTGSLPMGPAWSPNPVSDVLPLSQETQTQPLTRSCHQPDAGAPTGQPNCNEPDTPVNHPSAVAR